ncbi:MAG: preprotein translocase subunit YajC [Actinobacteria bacterium]|nr:preprotein translocase subunit YajC [Actinomycetota bacterium]
MSSSAGMLIIYVVAFIAIFYFMAIRPQQRQRRAHQALLSSLKKGDQIVTAAGIYGTVKRVEENIVVVEIAKGVTIKVARRAVAEIIRDRQEARAAAPEPRGRASRAEIEEQAGEVGDEDDSTEASVEEAEAGGSEESSEDDSQPTGTGVVGRISRRRK